MNDGAHWAPGKNSLELIELHSINKVKFNFSCICIQVQLKTSLRNFQESSINKVSLDSFRSINEILAFISSRKNS